jgi:glycyl-tRNA synthetase beta subunit
MLNDPSTQSTSYLLMRQYSLQQVQILNDGEDPVVASAISEHYHPRFSGDTLPCTKEGLCVAIADKVDRIVGIYGIWHKPTVSL